MTEKILVLIYTVLAEIYAVLAANAVSFWTWQGAPESHFRSNCFPFVSNMLLLWTFYSFYFKHVCLDSQRRKYAMAKSELRMLGTIEMSGSRSFLMWRKIMFFDASECAINFQKHSWNANFGKTSHAAKNTPADKRNVLSKLKKIGRRRYNSI